MDVAEFVELRDRAEHLGDVELSVFFLEHTRIVEQRSEISSGDKVLQRRVSVRMRDVTMDSPWRDRRG